MNRKFVIFFKAFFAFTHLQSIFPWKWLKVEWFACFYSCSNTFINSIHIHREFVFLVCLQSFKECLEKTKRNFWSHQLFAKLWSSGCLKGNWSFFSFQYMVLYKCEINISILNYSFLKKKNQWAMFVYLEEESGLCYVCLFTGSVILRIRWHHPNVHESPEPLLLGTQRTLQQRRTGTGIHVHTKGNT